MRQRLEPPKVAREAEMGWTPHTLSSETRGALEVAMVFGYITEQEAKAALQHVDTVTAMVYRLAR